MSLSFVCLLVGYELFFGMFSVVMLVCPALCSFFVSLVIFLVTSCLVCNVGLRTLRCFAAFCLSAASTCPTSM